MVAIRQRASQQVASKILGNLPPLGTTIGVGFLLAGLKTKARPIKDMGINTRRSSRSQYSRADQVS